MFHKRKIKKTEIQIQLQSSLICCLCSLGMFKFVFCADTHRFNLGSTVPVCPVAVVGLGVVAEDWNCREVELSEWHFFFCQMLLVQQICGLLKEL